MNGSLVLLAVLMAAVTYPSRAVPLLAPGLERLPPRVFEYLRLVGPGALAALAAVNTVTAVDAGRHASLHVGIAWLSVAACLAIVSRRHGLLPGIVGAVAIAALSRALGLA